MDRSSLRPESPSFSCGGRVNKGIKDMIFSDNKEDAVRLLIACNGILDEPKRIKELLFDLGYESPSGKFWRKAKKILFPF